MNRYLLAGSAVVALALGAGSANAQGKFEVRMGGDAVFEAHFLDQDRDTNARGSEFADRFRLNITAVAKADNGLEYGGRIRIRSMAGTGGNNATNVDRAYIHVGGGFGTVRMGTTNSYSDENGSVYWPIAFQTGPLLLNNQGVLSAGAVNTGTNTSTATSASNVSAITTTLTPYSNTDNGNATKIVYFSPRFTGFQLGASYTPRATSSGFDVSRTDNDNALSDVWELGLNYSGEFSGVGVKASVGYMGGTYADSGIAYASQLEDYGAWQGGLSVSYAGFTLGGGYLNKGESGQRKSFRNQDDFVTWGVGAQYATGPLTVGVSFTRGEGVVDPTNSRVLTGVSTTTTAGVTRYTGSVEQDQWAIGALYAVAPGLVVGAEYNYIDADAPGTAYDDKANVFILRSALIF
ncbi:MAG TPA: porin [Azospirillaceae bacterium]|nr:porin [Azospirillaceae bacterium]HRQ81445.1 porin [Azospirillaceae bacterium]